jgi:hypothetical protein
MTGVFSWSGPKNAWSRLLAFFFFKPLTDSTRNSWAIFFLQDLHSDLYYFFPGRSIDVTPVPASPVHLMTSHSKWAGSCYGHYLKSNEEHKQILCFQHKLFWDIIEMLQQWLGLGWVVLLMTETLSSNNYKVTLQHCPSPLFLLHVSFQAVL